MDPRTGVWYQNGKKFQEEHALCNMKIAIVSHFVKS